MQELSERDFDLSSRSSKKLEIVGKGKNLNKDVENQEKIEISQIKLTDNDATTKLLIKLPKSLSTNQIQIMILDSKERCYDNSHVQLLNKYFQLYPCFNFRFIIFLGQFLI